MAGYSKEFLIDAFMHRYKGVQINYDLRKMCDILYENAGKDEFRKYTSLDAEAIRKFKLETSRKS